MQPLKKYSQPFENANYVQYNCTATMAEWIYSQITLQHTDHIATQ